MKHWKTQIGPMNISDMVRIGQKNRREHTETERAPGRKLGVRETPKLAAFLKAPAESLDSILVVQVF